MMKRVKDIRENIVVVAMEIKIKRGNKNIRKWLMRKWVGLVSLSLIDIEENCQVNWNDEKL